MAKLWTEEELLEAVKDELKRNYSFDDYVSPYKKVSGLFVDIIENLPSLDVDIDAYLDKYLFPNLLKDCAEVFYDSPKPEVAYRRYFYDFAERLGLFRLDEIAEDVIKYYETTRAGTEDEYEIWYRIRFI